MIGTNKALTLAVTTAVALSVTAVAASGAQAATTRTKTSATAATTITVCVKTKTGAIKVLSAKQAKKKCAKGYKKLTWNAQGPAGKNGTNGTNGTNGANGLNGGSLKVHDSAGNFIGAFAGLGEAPNGLFNTYTVLGADGGLYNYLPSGQLVSNSVPLVFSDSACTGPAYIAIEDSFSPLLLAMAGSPFRFVVRPVNEQLFTFGPARAWKVTTDRSVVPRIPPTYYQLSALGCGVPVQPNPGEILFALREVPAPPDGVGVLKID